MNTQIDTPLATRIAALRQRAATPIELWQPDPGDCLIGEIVGSQKAVGPFGENHQVLVRDENGHVTATWITAWLKENLRAQGAQQGDLIALTYLGKKRSPRGQQYNAYSLIVERIQEVES